MPLISPRQAFEPSPRGVLILEVLAQSQVDDPYKRGDRATFRIVDSIEVIKDAYIAGGWGRGMLAFEEVIW